MERGAAEGVEGESEQLQDDGVEVTHDLAGEVYVCGAAVGCEEDCDFVVGVVVGPGDWGPFGDLQADWEGGVGELEVDGWVGRG